MDLNPDKLALAQALGATATVLAGPDAALPVNIVSLVAEKRTLKGSYIGTCVPSRDIPRLISLYRTGRLPVDRLVSGYPLPGCMRHRL